MTTTPLINSLPNSTEEILYSKDVFLMCAHQSFLSSTVLIVRYISSYFIQKEVCICFYSKREFASVFASAVASEHEHDKSNIKNTSITFTQRNSGVICFEISSLVETCMRLYHNISFRHLCSNHPGIHRIHDHQCTSHSQQNMLEQIKIKYYFYIEVKASYANMEVPSSFKQFFAMSNC